MKSLETYVIQILRIYLGAYYLESGLNYFLRFYPQPTGSGVNAEFISLITEINLFACVKALDIIAGACLIMNWFTPLMLILLFPTTVQIIIYDFHIHVL